ncbi:hypothetical protein ACEZDB_23750 [Streptacidiphilus sp. N1-3]|uniref:ANTAR domain-containing protein n=1 Tax=Streptacidiphilus alkalitolerans TaxID=3342712 RepID=A0ABV6X686_9ACTN
MTTPVPVPPNGGPSAEISVSELLARIQRAHDWAQLESAKNYALVDEHVQEGVMLQALAQQSRAAAFEAVRVVLEEILAPGTHTAILPG